jgi:hypothetical protein
MSQKLISLQLILGFAKKTKFLAVYKSIWPILVSKEPPGPQQSHTVDAILAKQMEQ